MRASAEAGVVLLVVLLAVTLLTIVVVEFTYSTQIDEHIAVSGRNGLQALYLARSGLNVAKMVLDLDARLDAAAASDSAHDLWAREVPPFPLGEGTVAFRIEDERAKINLNDLLSGGGGGGVNRQRAQVLGRLLAIIGVKPEILGAILDWIDRDDEPWEGMGGTERPYYLSLQPPLEPRNGELLTLSELLLVRGVDPELLERLSHFVTALPKARSLRVNVNTAPPEVLFALSDRMMQSPAVVSRIVEARERRPIVNWASLRELSGEAKAIVEINGKNLLRFDSDCFTITAAGKVAGTVKAVRETVTRKKNDLGGASFTTLAWRPAVATSLTRSEGSDFLAALATLKAGMEASR